MKNKVNKIIKKIIQKKYNIKINKYINRNHKIPAESIWEFHLSPLQVACSLPNTVIDLKDII